MSSTVIQWFPGHMAKTRRLIAESLPDVDIVLELLDARIPVSSKNPEIKRLVGGKPTLTLLTKASLADPAVTSRWKSRYAEENTPALFVDCISGYNMNGIAPAVKDVLAGKLGAYESKGMGGRQLRAMVVGIPNVGKSSLINRLAGARKADVENRPGVTLRRQWVTTSIGLELLDMPGVLWPKFDDKTVGENLAMTGAIKDQVLDTEHIACLLCGKLRRLYPELLSERYKLGIIPPSGEMSDFELLELIGRKRGFLVSGGEVNTERTAETLLLEFRAAKIGLMTLERPEGAH